MKRPFLYQLGFHNWKQMPDELGLCGMGLEWFQIWKCERCPTVADQVRRLKTDKRGEGYMYQIHTNL